MQFKSHSRDNLQTRLVGVTICHVSVKVCISKFVDNQV